MKPADGRYQTEIRARVKVLSLENLNFERVDNVHLLEGSMANAAMVRYMPPFRGLSPWYGIEWRSQELGRACLNSLMWIASTNSKRRERSEPRQAVGLAHSRGVVRVMPSESYFRHSKGLAILCKGKGQHYLASQRSD